MTRCFYYCRKKSKKFQPKTPAIPTSRAEKTSPGSSKHISQSPALVSSPRGISDIYEERGGNNLRVFELNDLKTATNNFSRLLKIGEGGFGSVYKGLLRNININGKKESKLVVAIKMLKQNSLQGHKQWLAEVQFLTVAEHTNLVKLIGYCAVDGERGMQRLLVYEYMSNKTLEDHLFNRRCPLLPWNSRLEIALGAARGLDFLHQGLETQVIYRDFKAANVLLDKELKPKLSDFGLAREGPSGDRTHVTTDVVGTYGYAAPEYIETGRLTAKTDVWSFGVVLFEIITGRRSVELARPVGEQKLLEWVKQFPAEGRRFQMIMDPRLRGEYSPGAARKVATLANQCLLKNPKERPAMHEVIESLKNAIQVTNMEDLPNKREEACSNSSSSDNG